MNSLPLYGRYIAVSIRAQMQYRMSFLMSAAGQFMANIIEVAAIWALFDRFGDLPNWNLAEVCLLYGVVNMAFAITDALTTGFDQFGSIYIKTGQFDRLLLRPRSVILQLFGHELALRRIGRLTQGLVVFIWGAWFVEMDWSVFTVGMLTFTLISCVAFFTALLIFQATLAIWTVESLEVMNTMTYGGVQMAQYPMDIYSPWFRRIFTYIIPLACVSYFPMILVMGKSDPLGSTALFQAFSPLLGFVFLGFSVLAFHLGIRKYTSTGS